MEVFVVLLRAVNVGGTGKLPMSDLKAMCEELGYSKVKTYIASGNVIFKSSNNASVIKDALEKKLESYAGKRIGVIVRNSTEMAAVSSANPFAGADGSRTVVLFLDECPGEETLLALKNQTNEDARLGTRELFIHYPDGISQSKLIIPAARAGTARNMNTVAKLAQLAKELA